MYEMSFAAPGRWRLLAVIALLFQIFPSSLRAATGGSISGAVTDASGAAIPASSLSLVNDALQTPYRAVSDREGLYAFPNLPVGHYTLTIAAAGFATQRKLNLEVDSDSAMRVDVTLLVAGQDGCGHGFQRKRNPGGNGCDASRRSGLRRRR